MIKNRLKAYKKTNLADLFFQKALLTLKVIMHALDMH
jgi:hypothetical protein